MSTCELCGKICDLVIALVEGVRFNVCPSCSSYGKVLESSSLSSVAQPVVKRNELVSAVVVNYSDLVKSAREKKQLTQKEFALKINEKESTLVHLENGTLLPSLELAKKLERFLNIQLITTEKILDPPQKIQQSRGFTLGDFIKK